MDCDEDHQRRPAGVRYLVPPLALTCLLSSPCGVSLPSESSLCWECGGVCCSIGCVPYWVLINQLGLPITSLYGLMFDEILGRFDPAVVGARAAGGSSSHDRKVDDDDGSGASDATSAAFVKASSDTLRTAASKATRRAAASHRRGSHASSVGTSSGHDSRSEGDFDADRQRRRRTRRRRRRAASGGDHGLTDGGSATGVSDSDGPLTARTTTKSVTFSLPDIADSGGGVGGRNRPLSATGRRRPAGSDGRGGGRQRSSRSGSDADDVPFRSALADSGGRRVRRTASVPAAAGTMARGRTGGRRPSDSDRDAALLDAEDRRRSVGTASSDGRSYRRARNIAPGFERQAPKRLKEDPSTWMRCASELTGPLCFCSVLIDSGFAVALRQSSQRSTSSTSASSCTSWFASQRCRTQSSFASRLTASTTTRTACSIRYGVHLCCFVVR